MKLDVTIPVTLDTTGTMNTKSGIFTLVCSDMMNRMFDGLDLLGHSSRKKAWVTLTTAKPRHQNWVSFYWTGLRIGLYNEDGTAKKRKHGTYGALDDKFEDLGVPKNTKIYAVLEVAA